MKGRERVILHSDLNNFFASVEIALNPALKGKPLIVCGDPKERKGIVLAKNEEAKRLGIKTAETVYSALKKCPDIQMVGSHFHEYNKYSQMVRDIYARYTDCIEVCSIDECALDMTESVALFGDGKCIAERIRQEVKQELGVTVSIGVSYNKVFAKLASELKKPDAVTEITKKNYQSVVWPLPVGELLFVGKSTVETLRKIGIKTIGDLANSDENELLRLFGKRGKQLFVYARGEDDSPVIKEENKEQIKSIGNSMTLPKDVTHREEIKRWIYALSESVAARLRKANVGKTNTVHIVVRNELLKDFTWQVKVTPTAICGDIAKAAYALFCQRYPQGAKVRMLGVSVSGFDYNIAQVRLDESMMFGQERPYEKKERVEAAVEKIRDKYGFSTLQRGIAFEDEQLNGLDIRGKKEE